MRWRDCRASFSLCLIRIDNVHPCQKKFNESAQTALPNDFRFFFSRGHKRRWTSSIQFLITCRRNQSNTRHVVFNGLVIGLCQLSIRRISRNWSRHKFHFLFLCPRWLYLSVSGWIEQRFGEKEKFTNKSVPRICRRLKELKKKKKKGFMCRDVISRVNSCDSRIFFLSPIFTPGNTFVLDKNCYLTSLVDPLNSFQNTLKMIWPFCSMGNTCGDVLSFAAFLNEERKKKALRFYLVERRHLWAISRGCFFGWVSFWISPSGRSTDRIRQNSRRRKKWTRCSLSLSVPFFEGNAFTASSFS